MKPKWRYEVYWLYLWAHFKPTGLFLYPLKISKNQRWLSDIFRRYRKRPLAWSEFMVKANWTWVVFKMFVIDNQSSSVGNRQLMWYLRVTFTINTELVWRPFYLCATWWEKLVRTFTIRTRAKLIEIVMRPCKNLRKVVEIILPV